MKWLWGWWSFLDWVGLLSYFLCWFIWCVFWVCFWWCVVVLCWLWGRGLYWVEVFGWELLVWLLDFCWCCVWFGVWWYGCVWLSCRVFWVWKGFLGWFWWSWGLLLWGDCVGRNGGFCEWSWCFGCWVYVEFWLCCVVFCDWVRWSVFWCCVICELVFWGFFLSDWDVEWVLWLFWLCFWWWMDVVIVNWCWLRWWVYDLFDWRLCFVVIWVWFIVVVVWWCVCGSSYFGRFVDRWVGWWWLLIRSWELGWLLLGDCVDGLYWWSVWVCGFEWLVCFFLCWLVLVL